MCSSVLSMADSSSSSSSVGKINEPEKDLPDGDMAMAAKQLMQLSGEDEGQDSRSGNSGNINGKTKKKRKGGVLLDAKKDQNQYEVTSAKISEEGEEEFRGKKRKYRSIEMIYEATKALNVNVNVNHGGKQQTMMVRPNWKHPYWFLAGV